MQSYRVPFVNSGIKFPKYRPNRIISNGIKVREFEEKAAEFLEAPYAVATNSGTMALYLAFRVLGFKNKRVATTIFTWRSTTEALIMAGATPVFFDIQKTTLTLDFLKLRDNQFDAICSNDCFGVPSDYDLLNAFGKPTVYDSASAFGTKYFGKGIGKEGVHCFSLSPTKILSSVEGGLITCQDEGMAQKLKSLRLWAGRMGEYNALCALKSLGNVNERLAEKDKIREQYHRFAREYGFNVQRSPRRTQSTWKDVIIIFDSEAKRNAVKMRMEDVGIETRNYFYPTNLFLENRQARVCGNNCSTSLGIYRRSLCFPCWPGAPIVEIIDEIKEGLKCQKLKTG